MAFVRPLFVLGGIALAACSSSSPASVTGSDDVTSIGESRVKEQLIGNCWIYATLGWVESLHLAHAKEELNLSESYLTYLHWFSRITADRNVLGKDGAFNTGDFVGWGEELVARYGVVDETAFVDESAEVDRSTRQEKALAVIDKAVRPGGALATPEARRDKAKVRALLDEAFGVPASVREAMTRTFGADLARTRREGAVLAAPFRDPKSLVVARAKTGETLTLDDALGELDPTRPTSATRDRGERRGRWAWERVPFGTTKAERDASVLRLKKALNAGFAVPLDWYPAWSSMRADDGSFHEPMNLARGGGWHSSLVHDYQLRVPGTGTLPVGVPVTDPATLAKTLLPDATIELLRFKNSWGREVGPLAARGYTDATWAYLATDFTRARIDYDETPELGAGIDAFILPPASWDDASH